MIAGSAIHSYCYFATLRITGAGAYLWRAGTGAGEAETQRGQSCARAHGINHTVSTGMLQSIRAVLVFGASALLFCDNDEAQCFTPAKGVATVVVAAGVVGYVLAR